MNIAELVRAQREAFELTNPLPYEARKASLLALKTTIARHEAEILTALQKDLNKSPAESYMTEIGMVLSEINDALRHLKSWMRPEKKRAGIGQLPGRCRLYKDPLGVVLIMAPWNYPFQLSLSPLVGALAAGNRCVLKPSNYAPETSKLLDGLMKEAFDPLLVSVVLGGREENQQLLNERFDYIFFTGGVTVGKLVLQKAAEHVTPVTLELGGKSPCIVDKTADLNIAARRIAFGKGLNSGQTCVAPDYCYVDASVREEFLKLLAAQFKEMYSDALQNDQWPKIVNPRHYERVMGLIGQENVYTGGHGNGEKIEPTILTNISWDSPVMCEEIFGPVLPILSFTHLEDVIGAINAHEKPLALYLFTRDKAARDMVLSRVSFGGGCVNDTILHLASSHTPFGGVGHSGMGRYHGKYSFDTFTHEKSVLQKALRPGLSAMNPPFTKEKFLLYKKVMR